MKMNVERKRRKGRPKIDTIENDTIVVGVCVGDVENRVD
jgi:hypothetical protein